jgi:hypothetical protein
MKRITFAGVAALALSFIMVLAGCPTETEPDPPSSSTALQGTWTRDGSALTFYENQWSLNDGSVSLSGEYSYSYSPPILSCSYNSGWDNGSGRVDSVDSYSLTLAGFTGGLDQLNGTWYKQSSSGGYTVSYTAGEGYGTPPSSQTAYAGQSIYLPGQESMTHPGGKTFNGWMSGNGSSYQAYESYTVNGNETFTARWTDGTSGQRWDEGVYIGLISFAGTSTDLTGGAPIRLDYAGKNQLNSMLNNQYMISSQGGTALFYGVHQALANLKAGEADYPVNLDLVNVITFTDGLDNGSTGQAALSPIEGQSPETTAGYAQYVQGQIAARPIAGKSIDAYSVGVLGSDVTDTASFQNTLNQIASAGKANELTDFSQVQEAFNGINRDLNITHRSAAFTMTTTLLESGTQVRMTFDGASVEAASSNLWIQGTVSRTGTGPGMTYTLSNITSSGIYSSEGTGPITGTINGPEVNFAFTNVTGLPDNLQENDPRVKQWLQTSGSSAWQVNSEYYMGNSVTVTMEHRSAIIYLVLDSSRSLNTSQIGQIRQAVQEFINSLYSEISQ